MTKLLTPVPTARIVAVQGAPSAVIQQLLAAAVARWQAQGLRVAGVIEQTIDQGGTCDAVLRDLTDGTLFAISQQLGPGSTACNLDTTGLAAACAAVQRHIADGCDLVVISKFGKQEAARGGLADAFAAAIEADLPVITSVSPTVQEAWAAYGAPLTAFIEPDAERIAAWWQGISAGTGVNAGY